MSEHLGKIAAREVIRCERAIASGSPIAFWQQRIGACLDEVNRASKVLDGCLKWLNRGAPKFPGES